MNDLYNPTAEQLQEILVGHSIRKVTENTLELDNGQRLKIVPNEGCGGCSSGWYDLTELNESPNVITRVETEEATSADGYGTSYRIYVYAENQQIKLAQVDGDDGNGYYGTGYEVVVAPATDKGPTA